MRTKSAGKLIVPACVLACAMVLGAHGFGQSTGHPPEFEVASIKPSGEGTQSVIYRLPGGRFKAQKATLQALITFAFGISQYELAGGPKWLDADRFDIEATSEQDVGNEPVLRDHQIKLMLQSLLAERFKLKTHPETRKTPAYVIVQAKGGPKLHAAAGPPGPRLGIKFNGRLRVMTFESAPISYVARMLADQMKRPVVDGTGLDGSFDFKLEFVPESVRLKANMDSTAPSEGTGADGPSIFTATQEQLGLKLQMREAPVQILVIDEAEKPTAN